MLRFKPKYLNGLKLIVASIGKFKVVKLFFSYMAEEENQPLSLFSVYRNLPRFVPDIIPTPAATEKVKAFHVVYLP